MSMRTHLKTLDKKLKRKIIAIMYANGADEETVTFLLNNGTLADISEYVDVEDLF